MPGLPRRFHPKSPADRSHQRIHTRKERGHETTCPSGSSPVQDPTTVEHISKTMPRQKLSSLSFHGFEARAWEARRKYGQAPAQNFAIPRGNEALTISCFRTWGAESSVQTLGHQSAIQIPRRTTAVACNATVTAEIRTRCIHKIGCAPTE